MSFFIFRDLFTEAGVGDQGLILPAQASTSIPYQHQF